jgi:predicted DsbA family dithiol-disulfide isomerase
MRIIHWSDFNCPYSYIGLKRLSDAVDELNLSPKWEMKSFELPLNLEIDKNIGEIAERDGLIINSVSLKSSRNAHRLAKFVRSNHPELSLDLIFKVYEANFSKDEDISDVNVLASIASSIGLDENIKEMLSGNSYDFEVELDTQDALFNGITSTPHYIIHVDAQQLIIPGAFEKEDFKIALEDLISGKISEKTFI